MSFVRNQDARYTAIFKLVPGTPGEFVQINEIPKAEDWGDAKRIDAIKSKLREVVRVDWTVRGPE